MKRVLNFIFLILFCVIIALITFIPKLISMAWYGTSNLNYSNHNYFEAITILAGTIIEEPND